MAGKFVGCHPGYVRWRHDWGGGILAACWSCDYCGGVGVETFNPSMWVLAAHHPAPAPTSGKDAQ